MSRFAFMARRPKRTLAVLALLLVAIAVTVGSGAQFTAQTANPTNTFTAGTLQMTNSANGTAIFTSPPLWKPADSRTGLVDIQNTGTLNGNFVLSTSNITGSVPLSNVLRVQIDDCGDWTGPGFTTPPTCTLPTMQTIYTSGTISGLSGLSTPGTGPGQTYVPNEKRRYFITVTWPNGTPAVDNPLQGTSTAFDFVWSAT
jgi:spore coat-associated protein N